MIPGVNHVALSVPDMDRALQFYCDLLGFKKLVETGWAAGTEEADTILAVAGTSARACHVHTENLLIELFQFGDCDPASQDPRRPVIDHGIPHICLAVTDLDDEYAWLSCMDHTVMESRNGLIVKAAASHATGKAERKVAADLLAGLPGMNKRTVGAYYRK